MIYIYSNSVTNRLEYTLDIVFKTILQVDYQLVDKEAFIDNTAYPKINYSNENLGDSIWIKPHSLLFETNIHPQDIQVTYKKEVPYFFKTAAIGSFQFDLFASIFYMLSRYEEYLPFVADEYGRFIAQNALAYKANFLEIPVVHLWVKSLRDAILKAFSSFLFPTRIYTQLNTIDIDIAYSYKGKSFKRRLGGFVKSLLSIDIFDVKNRISHLLGAKDPFDTYTVLKKLQDSANAETIYFFQVGKQGEYDKNLALNTTMLRLISKVSEYASIGIHPSYQSDKNLAILRNEKNDLAKITGKTITKSRQHYLKMSLADTYENLIAIGIHEDYTMGFPDQIGFRAGMAMPFPFFNLQTNQQRSLTIVPFQIMDGTLKDYMKLSPAEAIIKIQELKDAVKAVNGQFVSIFHNSSVTDKGEWKGWLAVYREVLK